MQQRHQNPDVQGYTSLAGDHAIYIDLGSSVEELEPPEAGS